MRVAERGDAMKMYQFTSEELLCFCNQLKDKIAEQSGIDLDDYLVTLAERKSLGRFLKKWLGSEQDANPQDLVCVITKAPKA